MFWFDGSWWTMTPRSASKVLKRLDGRFEAVFSGDELGDLFPGGSMDACLRRGILQDLGLSDTIPYCVCELRRPECSALVEEDSSGRFLAYCNDYGSPVEVSADQLRRYGFDWRNWADWLRRENGLGGVTPALGQGCMLVGDGTVAGRSFQLVVVAPAYDSQADIVLPADAVRADPPRVLLLLGDSDGHSFDDLAVNAEEVLGDDLIAIDGARLEALLVDVPVVIDDGDLAYRCFTHEHPKGKAISEAECERLRQKDTRAGYDLFIDLLDNRIWRSGRRYGTELKKDGRSNGKKLGPTSVRLLADYIKRPHHPMAPHVTPTYEGAAIDARSSSVRFSTVRRSIKGKRFLRSAATGFELGTGTYVFEPDEMSYCVVERIP
jgi:hypothetical protein